MKNKPYSQSGFTLVEMVIVILILSALAVTAYARMAQIDTQARQASLQAFKANILSVATMAKGVCMSDPQCADNQAAPSTMIEGNTIYFSQLVDAGKFSVQTSLSDSNRAIYYLQGARDVSRCKLEYAISTGAASTSDLTVSIDNSGC